MNSRQIFLKNRYTNLPKSWSLLPFEEVLDDVSAGKEKLQKSEYLKTGDIPVIDQGQCKIAGYSNKQSLKTNVITPLILFGDHTRTFKYIDFDFILGADGVKVLQNKNDVDMKYVYFFLKQLRLPDKGYNRHFKYLKDEFIPLPPVLVQKKISSLLVRVQDVVGKRRETLRLADEFLKSAFLEMFGDPNVNPKQWSRLTVGELHHKKIILEIQDGNHGEIHPKSSEFLDEGVPFIFCNHISSGRLNLNNCPYLAYSRVKQLRIGFSKGGDVLFSHKGSIGFSAVVPKNIDLLVLSPQVTYYRLDNDKLNPVYLANYFQTQYFQSHLKSFSSQSTRAYVGITRQKDLPVLFPDISVQDKFADVVHKVERYKEKLKQSEQQLENLFNSLMQKAFKGELF